MTTLRDTWRGYAQLDRRIWSIAGVRTINTMGLSLAMAFVAIYLVNERGTTAQLYGLMFLVANLGRAIACTLVVSFTLRGCFEPVAYALVADVAKPQDRVLAFGLQRMGTNLGWAIGPASVDCWRWSFPTAPCSSVPPAP